MDTVEEGRSAMTIELLGGFSSGSDLGDVSLPCKNPDNSVGDATLIHKEYRFSAQENPCESVY